MVCGSKVCMWCVEVRLRSPDRSGKCRNLFKIIIIIIKTNKPPKQTFGAEMQETAGRSWKWDDCWISLLCLRATLVFLQFLLLMDVCLTCFLKTILDNRDSATSSGKGINVFLWENFSDYQTSFFEASLKFGVTVPVNIWHKDQTIPFLLAAALNQVSVGQPVTRLQPPFRSWLPELPVLPAQLQTPWFAHGSNGLCQ